MMSQEEDETQCEEVIKETCFQLLCEALFLTAVKYLSRKETQKTQWDPFRSVPEGEERE